MIFSVTTTVATLAGSECCQSMKIGFEDAIREINEVIQQGSIELKPVYNVPVKIFLGGDYKVRKRLITIQKQMHSLNLT